MNTQSRHDELAELLEKRTSIQKWLAGLEAQRGSASNHVLDRVRADYEGRLAQTLQALASHVDGVRSELKGVQERISGSEDEHAAAVDALEEGRVRNAIGELDDSAWAEQRGSLEDAVQVSESELTAARQEADRLREVLNRLGHSESDASERSSAASVTGDRSALLQSSPVPATIPGAEPATPAAFDDEATVESWDEEIFPENADGFLEAIDRALSDGELADTDPGLQPRGIKTAETDAAQEPEADTAPKPGLKCGECGYTNDLNAWFCGVCGADVG